MARKHWRERKQDEEIAKAVISSMSKDSLITAHKFLSNLLDYKVTKKLETTYVNGIKNATVYNQEDRIYCSYNFDGTVTGRLSCGKQSAGNGKPMGVSFHTLPRSSDYNIRSVVVAPPGYVFVTVDYAAMELRVLSHIAKEHKMQQAFISGDDLHWYTTELIARLDNPLITRDQLSSEDRQAAKETSFLIVYGGTEITLANKLNVSIEKATSIMNSWFTVYDAVPAYMDFVFDFIRKNKYAYSLFGRKRTLENVKSPNQRIVKKALRQGLNFTIQSVASDILLCALLGISLEFKDRKMKSRVCQTVHDSIEALVKIEEFDEAIEIIHRNMTKNPIMTDKFNIELAVPLVSEYICGHSFGDGLKFEKGEIPSFKEIEEYMYAG